jgi:hypothetical protein
MTVPPALGRASTRLLAFCLAACVAGCAPGANPQPPPAQSAPPPAPRLTQAELDAGLVRAAAVKDAGSVVRLLSEGANPNATNFDGLTPLMMAAGTGQAEVVDALLAKGANAEARTKRDEVTALMFAAHGGHGAVIETLLAKGANVRAKDGGGDLEAIDYAAMGGHKDAVARLKATGAVLKERDALGAFIALGGAPDLDGLLFVAGAKEGSGERQLFLSVLEDDEARVKTLLALGVKPSDRIVKEARTRKRTQMLALLEGVPAAPAR